MIFVKPTESVGGLYNRKGLARIGQILSSCNEVFEYT